MPDPAVTADRWHKRPGLARAYRVYAMAGPLIALLGITFLAAELLPAAGGAVTAVLRWSLIAGLALAGASLAERTLRRLLPISALLDLDLGFPGAVPPRSRIASLASLGAREAELVDLLPDVAGRDLDAAAEHVVVSYASTTRSGLRPRSHAARVRAVATLVAERLDLDRDDLDRLQWALVLRELGTVPAGRPHPHQPMVAWLGPWRALLQGPFIDVATGSASSAVSLGAHAAAVADAYVVVTAAHPYERSLDGGSSLPLEALAAARLSPVAVEALLDLSVPARRRAAGFTSGVPSRLVRYTPNPQPVFALASLLAVVAFMAGGVGTGPTTLPAKVAAGDAAATVADRSTPAPQGRADVVEAADRGPDTAGASTASAQPRQVTQANSRTAGTSDTRPGTTDSSDAVTQGVASTSDSATRAPSAAPAAPTAPATPTVAPSPAPSPAPSSAPSSRPSPGPSAGPGPAPSPDPEPAPEPTADPGPGTQTDAEPRPAPSP